MLKDKPRWCLPLPSEYLPLINRHKGRVYDVTHCFILEKKMRSSILIKCLVSVFLRINYVPSSIYNEVDRFIACEQDFGRAGLGEGKAKRPVDKHLGSSFHGTRSASDLDASSCWQEH